MKSIIIIILYQIPTICAAGYIKESNQKMNLSRDMTKPTKVCAQRRFRSAWASAKSSLGVHSFLWLYRIAAHVIFGSL